MAAFRRGWRALFPELMAELDEIKLRIIGGLAFRRDHRHRRSGGVSKAWVTDRGEFVHLRSTVKDIMRHAGLPEELSFTSFQHGGFTEGAAIGPTPSYVQQDDIAPQGSCRPTLNAPRNSSFQEAKNVAGRTRAGNELE